MLIESGDKLTAIKYLEEALKISPNFALAKGNLATILKEEELVEKK
jgi:Tfp pilus assembly protein PilF